MEAEALAKPRAKLFHRLEAPPNMELTGRDMALLAHVARHRFLTSAHLAALDGGSPQGVLRCLRVLYDHGYLDRPKAQLAAMYDLGPQPFVYGIGQKGMRALRQNPRVDWTEKNKRAGAIFIAHTLEIAHFMVSLELACRAREGIALLRDEDILAAAPEATRTAREPLRWQIENFERGKREVWSVVPDGLFGLKYADGATAYFLLELDRGTIPIRRTGGNHRSIKRKLQTYYYGWRAGRHMEQFGAKQVRVLMVTPSPERVRNMVEAVEEITDGKGSNFFLFLDQEALQTSNPLEAPWLSGKGETVRLTV
jgi:hypothetical protein